MAGLPVGDCRRQNLHLLLRLELLSATAEVKTSSASILGFNDASAVIVYERDPTALEKDHRGALPDFFGPNMEYHKTIDPANARPASEVFR